MRYALIALATIFFFQQPAKSPEDKGIAKRDSSAQRNPPSKTNANKTQAACNMQTVIIQDQPRPASRDESENYNKNNTDTDGRLVTVTIWLVVVSGLQFFALCVQSVVFWFTLRQINRQANTMDEHAGHLNNLATAAKRSADIAAGVSIPTLRVESFDFWDRGVANVEALFARPKVKIVVKNYGETPAFLKSYFIVFTCEELPQKLTYGDHGIILEKVVVEPGASYTLPLPNGWNMQVFSDDDVKAILDRSKTFNAYGCIGYADLFGSPLRRLKFCETILNIFPPVDVMWVDELAPPIYRGNEYIEWKPVG